jgi:predicted GNAT superfamily acetyltransferase
VKRGRYGCLVLEHIASEAIASEAIASTVIDSEIVSEAGLAWQLPAGREGIEIRSLEVASEIQDAAEIFDLVWPPLGGGTQVPPNLLRAITHSGGYCSAAYVAGEPVAAALALVGLHEDAYGPHVHLHSHMAGVLESYRNQGIGTLIKAHQRWWALSRGIDTIVWTFDPLVARNAKLNLVNLGVSVRDYEVNFYGAMTDAINVGGESDRVFAWWDLTSDQARAAARGELGPIMELSSSQVVVQAPEDIVALRASDPKAAQEWRFELRKNLMREFAAGREIVGVTTTGDYVLDIMGEKERESVLS